MAKTHQEDEEQHFLAWKARKTKGFLVHQMSATQFRHYWWHSESDSLTVAFFISIFPNQSFFNKNC
ncbi:hypothetical protein BWP24_16100 [Vibrio campbellii]|nr:hypothetical protein BWP24_16100 [Vibrio campbellii]